MAVIKTAADRWLDPTQTRLPYWLRGSYSGRVGYAIMTVLDALTEHLWEGISERFPELASEEGLAALGRDRRIARAPGESIASYRARLMGWQAAWENAGTAIGQLVQVQKYFLPAVPKMRLVSGNASHARWTTINEDGSREYLRTTGPVWDWDSAQPDVTPLTASRRWWLIVYPPAPYAVNDSLELPSETQSAGSTFTVDQGLGLYQIANSFRMAGAVGWGVIVAFDPASFNPDGSSSYYPDGTWYRTYNPSDPGAYNRDPSARFLDQYVRVP